MKKCIALATLVLATATFAMNFTGNVYLDASPRKAESIYLSVGCTAKNDSGVVRSIGANDIAITAKDQFNWFKVPVKTLLQGDTIAPFCFYRSLPDSVRTKVYDEDSVLTGYTYVKSYKSTRIFTANDFKNQDNLYIDFGGSSLFYEDVTPPKIFYKSNWSQDYVVVNGSTFKVQKKRVDGWSIVQDELKTRIVRRNIKIDSVQKMQYKVTTHCLDDGEGNCVFDEETGSSVMVRDTVDSSKVWVRTSDTLAVDTLYNLFNGKIIFADVNTICGGNYTTLEYFNINSAFSTDYYCVDATKYGIDVSTIKDSVYIFEDPKKEHSTLIRTKTPATIYKLHVLPPQVKDWFGEIPALGNGDSDVKTAMKVNEEHCGWYSTVFFEEALPTKATFSGKANASMQFASNVNVDSLYKELNTSELYYVANDPNKTYWYAKYPEQDGICEVHLRGIVYDTDAKLHPAFSCYSPGGEGCQTGAQDISSTVAVKAINACIGVTPGIVEELLGPDNKPVLSKAGEKCFINSNLFDQLFNSTEEVNETSCSTIPFTLNKYGKWEFSSDYYVSPGTTVMGGFYPAEGKKDDDIVVGTPLTAARTKREAEGPVFIGPKLRELDSTENVMKMNVLCNGIGWNKGIDCKGLFADGEDIIDPSADYLGVTADGNFCVWGWSCPNQAPDGWAFFSSGTETYSTPNSGSPRWTSLTGRNQHFCFESHAKFTYKKGQRFGVRGDDDIWIFIGGRLAIDLGGTHMAAPGYADLSRLTDKNGDALVVGKTYDIDIFFCDRRTTMSNMNFFSNIYLDQSESIDQMKPCEVDVEHIFDDDSLNPGRTVVPPSIALPAQMRVAVEGRLASVTGVKPGSELILMDMQGRVIGRYYASSANVKIEIRNAGRYILKTATGLQVISVR